MQDIILEVINVFFELCIYIFTARIVSDRRERVTAGGILFLAAVGVGFLLIDVFIPIWPITLIKTAVSYFLIHKVYYRNSLFKSLLYTALLICAIMLADVITSVVISYWLDCGYDEQFANMRLIGSYISDFITLSLMIPFCLITKNKYRSMPFSYSLYLILCPICSCYILFLLDTLLQKAAVNDPYYIVIPAVAVFYLNVTMFNMFDIYSYKLELSEIKQKEQMNWENYQILRESEETIRILRHDMKNHLGIIGTQISSGADKAALEYINTINAEIDSKGRAVYTQNPTLDAILNMKRSFASQNGVSYYVKTNIQNEIGIQPMDLCTVLGNAIDNAVEASALSEQKFVSISITDDESRVFFVITNSTDKRIDGRLKLRTTKADIKNHGLGIRSMEKTLKKYDGILDFNYTESMCTLRFSMLNVPIIPD